MPKFRKRQKCCLFCAFIGVIIIVLSLGIIQMLLDNFIAGTVVMTQSTKDLWGENPGKTQTITSRNFTFYNFSNPRQFLYRNQIPHFQQITGYAYQQMSNFTNHKYNSDRSQISFNYWLFFKELQNTKNCSDYVTILNPVPLGFWSQLQQLQISTFALQGFGGLFLQLNQTIKLQAIGQGVAGLFLTNYTNLQNLCSNIQISEMKCKYLWNDPINGLGDGNNYLPWIKYTFMNDKQALQYLKNYFALSIIQINHIQSQFNQWCSTINQILNNWYCNGKQCDSYELTLLQISSGGVTGRPPIGTAVDSICSSGNITCQGSPEISTFLKKQFKAKFPDKKYQKLKFSLLTFKQLFAPRTGTLLNIGNLTQLFHIGEIYDYAVINKWNNQTQYLSNLRHVTHSDSNDHAFVIWQWVKYFTNDFVLKQFKLGTRKITGLAGLFAQSIYTCMSNFGGWILQDYQLQLSRQYIGDCVNFISNITTNKTKIQLICKNVSLDSYQSYFKILQPYVKANTYEKFQKQYHLTALQMNYYYNKVEMIVKQAHLQIYSHYNCTMSISQCTAYELGLLQWINSSITLNPMLINNLSYPISITGTDWNKQLLPFQYTLFLKQSGLVDPQKNNNLTQLIDLMSFNKFFSVPMMTNMLLQTNFTQFYRNYYWNVTLLRDYAKFIAIEAGFGGLTMKRRVKDIIFGYTDEFLQQLRITNPMQGGDPSIKSLVAFNQPNSTLEQASLYPETVYSGISDCKLTRRYVNIYNKTYITFNKTWYDGYQIHSQFISPYPEHVKIFGTDAFQNPPNLPKQQQIYVYITTLFRVAKLKYYNDTQKYGFNLRRYIIDDQLLQSQYQNVQNAKFSQQFNGFLNLSFQGLPLFISRNHFYKAPENWSQLISIHGQNNSQITANQWDDTYLFAEPHSGASFTAVVFLQTNYYFTPDVLFKNNARMLPIFSVYRSGNISQSTAVDLFSDLKLALKFTEKTLPLGIIILLCSILFVIGFRVNIKTNKIKLSSLAQSVNDIP